MMELLDMGKYDLYVWGSIGVFIVALVVDFISASNKQNNIKNQIKAQNRQTDARQTDSRQTDARQTDTRKTDVRRKQV